MYKEQLLDNQTRKEYLLIKLLYLHDFRVEKKLVCEKLNISYPTIKKIIDRINDYLETYYPQEDIELLSTKHDLIFHNNSSIPVDDLTKFYFIHSEKYILLDLLFKSPHITRNKLSQKMNISSTTLNIIILQCNELLKEFELQISQGTIKGNLVQYFYFYFLFYWWTNSSPFSYNSETQYLDFDQFLYEQNQEKLGPIEEKKLFLWLTLLKNQRKIVNTYSISSNENIHVKDNQLYHELKLFFKKHWKIFSTEDISKVSYITFAFLNSFEVLDRKLIELHSCAIQNERTRLISKIIILLQSDFNLDNSYQLTYDALYYLLGSFLFFKGNIYPIDKITLDFYLDNNFSSFEKDIVLKIVQSDTLFKKYLSTENGKYFQYVLYTLVSNLKRYRKNHVNIALLLNTTTFLYTTFLLNLEEFFQSNSSINISKYCKHTHYDLVITNVQLDKFNFNENYYFISDLCGTKDFKDIYAIIDEIN
ncbi:helix-turn-helix domain-containing protein [Enterococcus faecium]|uniref:helix-turn-helix domain-containing protein n=3 Tax=Enterococcus TaxID=1350 RepID=UPI000BF068F7|nr:helix-turn-helix domain-containing protein [Enterococcus faecium]EME8125117.1 helix-turn-helix domain-containing protein [Enterococcus faecium]PEH49711.1 hypothetical protein CRM75_00730 [Enterococcus faecium]